MNLHQLRIFTTVARLGSFSRAAEELSISQPSVSIQVADLERSLGVDLFEKLGKRIYLTEAGRILDEYARRMLGLAEEARIALEDIKGLHRGRLMVGATTTPGTYILPRVIAAFQERHPQVAVVLEIADAKRIQERLLRNEIDLGVVGWEVTAQDLRAEPFLDDELVLVASPSHPLATAGRAHAKGLRDHRLILRERGSGTREALEAALREAGVAIAPSMELGTGEAVKEAVVAGLGVTIISRLAVAGDVHAGRLVIVPMPDLAIRRRFSFVYHRDKRFSQAITTFRAMLLASVATVAS